MLMLWANMERDVEMDFGAWRRWNEINAASWIGNTEAKVKLMYVSHVKSRQWVLSSLRAWETAIKAGKWIVKDKLNNNVLVYWGKTKKESVYMLIKVAVDSQFGV